MLLLDHQVRWRWYLSLPPLLLLLLLCIVIINFTPPITLVLQHSNYWWYPTYTYASILYLTIHCLGCKGKWYIYSVHDCFWHSACTFIYFLGGLYCSCLLFIQFHSLFCWILRFPCSERPSFKWAWPVRSFHPCLHRRLLAALSVAHGGLGKTLLSHILVKIMVKIVAKVVDNFIVFWAGVFCD